MKGTGVLMAIACVVVGCSTGPAYTKPGPDNDNQAMESQLKKCESMATAPGRCQSGSDSYNYCVKAATVACMRDAGWTQQ